MKCCHNVLFFLKTLFNHTMKPHQLEQHLSKVHPHLADKNWEFFEIKANHVKMRLDSVGQLQKTSKAIVTMSYAVFLQEAEAKKCKNIAEPLISHVWRCQR